jgi:hypothetical protein
MSLFPFSFICLATGHIVFGADFFFKYRMKWSELVQHPNEQGREYYFRRARRQLFATLWSLAFISYDLWFAMILDEHMMALPKAIALAVSTLSFPALYTLGKYRYEWKDLGKHFKTCWQQRKLTWH